LCNLAKLQWMRRRMRNRGNITSIHYLYSHNTPSSCNHRLQTSKKCKKKLLLLLSCSKRVLLSPALFYLILRTISKIFCIRFYSAVGMPQIKAITINNPSPSQTLQLTSVSGDTADFHPSFFQSKVSIYSHH